MEYVCKVGTPTGEVVERTFAAPDEAALRTDLEQQGYYLFAIRRGFGLGRLRLRRPRVAPSLLLIFSQEFAALLKAGLPLFQSLDVTLDRQKDPVFPRPPTTSRPTLNPATPLPYAFLPS